MMRSVSGWLQRLVRCLARNHTENMNPILPLAITCLNNEVHLRAVKNSKAANRDTLS